MAFTVTPFYKIKAKTLEDKARAAIILMDMADEDEDPNISVHKKTLEKNFKHYKSWYFERGVSADKNLETIKKGRQTYIGRSEKFEFAAPLDAKVVIVSFFDDAIDPDEFLDQVEFMLEKKVKKRF